MRKPTCWLTEASRSSEGVSEDSGMHARYAVVIKLFIDESVGHACTFSRAQDHFALSLASLVSLFSCCSTHPALAAQSLIVLPSLFSA